MKRRILSCTLALVMLSALVLTPGVDVLANPQQARVPVQHNLPEDKLQRLNDFFSHFMHSFSVIPTLGDYDAVSPDGAYAALDFVLSNSVFLHGRLGELGLPHYGFVEYMGGTPIESWSPSTRFEFVCTSHVDAILLRYFNITNFRHDPQRITPVFGFQYRNGRYYYEALAQGGWSEAIQNIFAFYDNGNGTYSARIQYLTIELGDDTGTEVHVKYNIAVIQPFEDTFQMLYWRNNVSRNASIPTRQSTAAVPPATPAQNDLITVTINNTSVNFVDQPPTIVDGRTLVPVRGVFEALGFVPTWNEEARQATLTRADATIVITIDSVTFTTNGVSHALDVPAQIIGGRTMVPLRAILESVGYDLDWDGVTRTVIVTTS